MSEQSDLAKSILFDVLKAIAFGADIPLSKRIRQQLNAAVDLIIASAVEEAKVQISAAMRGEHHDL